MNWPWRPRGRHYKEINCSDFTGFTGNQPPGPFSFGTPCCTLKQRWCARAARAAFERARPARARPLLLRRPCARDCGGVCFNASLSLLWNPNLEHSRLGVYWSSQRSAPGSNMQSNSRSKKKQPKQSDN